MWSPKPKTQQEKEMGLIYDSLFEKIKERIMENISSPVRLFVENGTPIDNSIYCIIMTKSRYMTCIWLFDKIKIAHNILLKISISIGENPNLYPEDKEFINRLCLEISAIVLVMQAQIDMYLMRMDDFLETGETYNCMNKYFYLYNFLKFNVGFDESVYSDFFNNKQS